MNKNILIGLIFIQNLTLQSSNDASTINEYLSLSGNLQILSDNRSADKVVLTFANLDTSFAPIIKMSEKSSKEIAEKRDAAEKYLDDLIAFVGDQRPSDSNKKSIQKVIYPKLTGSSNVGIIDINPFLVDKVYNFFKKIRLFQFEPTKLNDLYIEPYHQFEMKVCQILAENNTDDIKNILKDLFDYISILINKKEDFFKKLDITNSNIMASVNGTISKCLSETNKDKIINIDDYIKKLNELIKLMSK